MQNLNKIIHDVEQQCKNINTTMNEINANLDELNEINNTFKSICQSTGSENREIISSNRKDGNKKKLSKLDILVPIAIICAILIFNIIGIYIEDEYLNHIADTITIAYVIFFSDIINIPKYFIFFFVDDKKEFKLHYSLYEWAINTKHTIMQIIEILVKIFLPSIIILIILAILYYKIRNNLISNGLANVVNKFGQ